MKNLIGMTDFLFKDVINYPDYKISECGEMLIKKQYTDLKGNFRKEKVISQFLDSNGRVKVMLYNKGERKNMSVPRLVAITFIPNPENKPEVNHIDGNVLNNHKDNLEWNTGIENKQHAVLNGLTAKGEKSGKSILTEIIVKSIKADLKTGNYTNIEIAKRNNTSVYNVSDIKNNRTWSHLN